ncbi:MBL fold metallo-hydrolase [Parvicella tangerina]|uniref:Phosphoribosyl 1,2-cyclic phosphate phosphodiesterase n=1 Tax=Parvicella tangerina TaxID=2829795 RepID=A0A916NGH3_9FLAO|nr:MBL fold metallo-hydrolase [Parvicella tangerina]CAG5079783.1 Phosphoribosyl 1,2-cyclic phosphate phosphodiesterase [Parvicella tangerina]
MSASKLEIKFLGTGTSQGVPVITCDCDVCISDDPRDKRLRSSIAIKKGNTQIVIDSGPDFRQQMLRAQINHLDALVFTHAHKDHIAGMDDVRAYNFKAQKPMEVYCTDLVFENLKREFHYVFDEAFQYPGIPRVDRIRIDKSEPFKIGEMTLVPIEVMHYKLPVLGFRVDNFTYITDANYISESEKEKIKGTEILVLNALRKEKHISHFTLEEALDLIEEIAPKKAYLTHVSHLMGRHKDIAKELPENVSFAFDGLSIKST